MLRFVHLVFELLVINIGLFNGIPYLLPIPRVFSMYFCCILLVFRAFIFRHYTFVFDDIHACFV